jgi:hypothetical protein
VKAGGGERGGGRDPLALGQLERDPPAQRVAGDVRSLELELVQEASGQVGEGLDPGRRPWWRHRGGAEPREVERDHVTVGLEAAEHRQPHLPVAPDTVNQDQGRTGAGAVVFHVDVLSHAGSLFAVGGSVQSTSPRTTAFPAGYRSDN